MAPNPQCGSGKNRRPGDRAKPDFDKLLRVGAWGRASGSRVDAHSTTPSARVACPWGANRRYDTKFTQTILIAPLCSVLCLDATEVALPKENTIWKGDFCHLHIDDWGAIRFALFCPLFSVLCLRLS